MIIEEQGYPVSLSRRCYNVVPGRKRRTAPVTIVTTDFPALGDHLSGKIEWKGIPDVSFQSWLRGQVQRLEGEIGGSAIFDCDTSCSHDELQNVKRLVVIRGFLEQQLRRMENRRLSRIDRRSAGSRPETILTSA